MSSHGICSWNWREVDMLRKYFVIIICFCMLVITGCSGNGQYNQISPMRLTDEQQKVLDLLSSYSQQMLLFEFNTAEPFTEVGVRLEVYEYGELVETLLGFAMVEIDAPLDGNIAVVINDNRYEGTLDFTVTLSVGGSTSSSHATAVFGESMMGRAFGPMNDAVDIHGNTDAVIYVSRFTGDGMLTTHGNLQNYLNPSNFARYPLVHVLIADFTQ